MEIQPLPRRAAQAAGVVLLVGGCLVLLLVLWIFFSLVRGTPGRTGPCGWLVQLGAGVLGGSLVLAGRKLIAWGSGE